MKHNRSLLNYLTICVVTLVAAAAITTQAAEERVAKVVRVKGSARTTSGGDIWQPIKVGDNLKAGMVVQTAANSVVDVVFTETLGAVKLPSAGEQLAYNPTVQRDIIRIQPDSVLAIDKLTTVKTGADEVTETQLDLRSGRIIGAVNKVSAASTFEIKIPNGVAGVRGTIFSVSALGIISVLHGAMGCAFNTPDGPKVEDINSGFELDIRTGEIKPIPATLEREMRGSWRGFNISDTKFVPPDHTNEYCSGTVGEK